jgi:inner membrane protein
MPSVFSHPAVPLALATVLPPEVISPSIVLLSIVCSTVPDLDVVGFRFGVPRGHLLGHRGLSHSIVFAVCLSGCLTWLLPAESQPLKVSPLTVFLFLFLSTLSHGILDAMTTGGSGVAFFAPVHNQRYFLPWRPIHVSPISLSGFFSARGVRVLRSEMQWIWLPAACVAIVVTLLRRMG